MEQTVMIVITVVTVVIGSLGIFAAIRNCAIESIGELKYMLREARKRQEIFYTEEDAKAIKNLEYKIENHWGRKLVRKKDMSIFDIL